MNTINFSKISFNFLFISFIMLLFLLGGCAKKVPHTITLDNGQKAILTKGIVKKVNLKNNTILFKQLNGP
ncbi:MAG: YgdI/YgdR family lipoprotein, partial [Desulfobulbaceae bacterium]|nr:YgdI/YgdR family lipoprotein [Desulfobulbaceae bacterium]